MADHKKMSKAFPITSVCRADIAGLEGFNQADVDKLDDGDMERLASKMADAYCNEAFWIDLEIIAEYILEKKKPCSNCGKNASKFSNGICSQCFNLS